MRPQKIAPASGADRVRLVHVLERCAAVCRQTLASYDEQGNEFGRALAAAVAAIETVASPARTSAESEAALARAAKRCRAAADACRRDGFDRAILRTAAACDEAALLCDRARRR
jgi:hypothetical protein